jgi:hypothetical protein
MRRKSCFEPTQFRELVAGRTGREVKAANCDTQTPWRLGRLALDLGTRAGPFNAGLLIEFPLKGGLN